MGDDTADANPLVTVIMPARNCEQYIAAAIESVIAQTYDNWELLCVDDGSSDGTGRIIESYASQDPRIRLIRNRDNINHAFARNVALQHAHGEFMAPLDADDVALPDRLERSLAVFGDKPEVDVIGSSAVEIDEHGRENGIWQKDKVVHSSIVARMSAVRAVGGYDSFFDYAPDSDLFRRMGLRYTFHYIEQPLVKYRSHGDQITSQHSFEQWAYSHTAHLRARALARGQEIDLQATFDRLMSDPRVRAWRYYEEGWTHLDAGDRAGAGECFAKALGRHPWYPTAMIWYVLCWLPKRLLEAATGGWHKLKGRLQAKGGSEDGTFPF